VPTKFQENPSVGSEVIVMDVQTDGRTDTHTHEHKHERGTTLYFVVKSGNWAKYVIFLMGVVG
jgi:hypothetical protein